MPRTGKDYVVFGVSKTKSLDRRKTKNESPPSHMQPFKRV